MALFGALEQELRLDKSQFSRELDEAEREMESVDDQAESTGSSFASMGEKMQSAGKGLTLGVTAPLGLIGAKSLQAASDVEEMQSKMSTVFGEQTKQIKQWAKTQEEATGISELQWQEYATTLQDTFKPMGFAQEEATKMSKEVTNLAVDLASFNNMPTSEALDRLQGGLAGNHENLKAFGVLINQTSLGEKLEEMFGKGMDAATEQEKAQARLQLVMEGTTDAQGDAARTSESFANQMRSLKGAAREAAAQFGQALMPAVKPLVGLLKEGVGWFSNLSKETKTMIAAGAGLAAALGPVLVVVGTLLTLPISGPMLAAAAAFSAVAAAVIAFRDKLKPIVGAIIPRLKQAINDIVPIIKSLASQFLDILIPAVKDTVNTVLGLWQRFGPQISRIINKFIAIWRTIFETFLGALVTIWKKHGDGIMNVLRILKDVVVGMITTIGKIVLPIIERFLGATLTLWRRHGDTIKRILVRMADIIAEVLTVLGQTIKKIVTFISNTWTNTIKPLIATTKQTFNQIVSAIKGPLIFIRDNIIAPIINWISRQWSKHGDKIMSEAKKTWNAIRDAIKLAITTIREAIQPFINWINEKWTWLQSKLGDSTKRNWNGIKSDITTVINAIKRIINAFIDLVSAAWSKWGDDLLRLATNIFNAIKGAIEFYIDGVLTVITAGLQLIRGDWKSAWNTIRDFLKRTFRGIQKFADKWTRGLRETIIGAIDGIINWLTVDAPNAFRSAFESMADAAISGFNGVMPDELGLPEIMLPEVGFDIPGLEIAGQQIYEAQRVAVGPFGPFGGQAFDIPQLETGGFIEKTGAALLHGGERVLPAAEVDRRESGGSAPVKIDIHVDGSKSPEATARAIDRKLGQAGVNAWRS